MAYKTYTLEQVRRTSDMSHAVYQNVNNDFLNIVSQFGTNINSDYILRFGTVNYALTNSGTEYNQTLITSSNHSANAIPIQRITNLKKLTLSVKCTKSYSTSYSYIVFYMADVNDDGTHNYGHKKIFQRLPGNAPVDTYDDLKTFSDDNWHTYEFEWAEELHRNINYVSIEFNNCYGYVKDIVWETWGQDCTSNGGGATHIAKVTGQLKDLSSNMSDILMVSGGGGGGYLVGENAYNGADAGGISGSGSNSGNQSTGYAFGQGESGTNKSGGGGGLYGGYKGTSSKSGGAGSGYIGNSLLSNKKMVGYNVPTSSAEGTKTESVNEASESAVSGKPKSGNGFARIKLLNESKTVTYKSIAKTSDMTHYVTGGDGSNANIKGAFSSYKNTDYILWSAISSSMYSRERPFDYNNSTGIFSFNSTNYAASGFYGYVLFPFIPKSKILKVSFKVRIQTNSSTDFGVRLRDTDLNSSTMLTMFLSDPATQMDWATVEYTVPDAYRNTEYGWLQMHFQVKAEVKDIVFTYLE